MTDYGLLSERIKELRKEKGMTQKEFADSIDTSTVTVSAYENDSTNPSLDIVMRIAQKYAVSIDWLVGLSEQKSTKKQEMKMEKYNDLMAALFSLENKDIPIIRDLIGQQATDNKSHAIWGVGFDDPVVSCILRNWAKLSQLYAEGVIDDVVYTAWKEKVYNDFNYEFMKKEDHEKFWKEYVGDSKSLDDIPDYNATRYALETVQLLY